MENLCWDLLVLHNLLHWLCSLTRSSCRTKKCSSCQSCCAAFKCSQALKCVVAETPLCFKTCWKPCYCAHISMTSLRTGTGKTKVSKCTQWRQSCNHWFYSKSLSTLVPLTLTLEDFSQFRPVVKTLRTRRVKLEVLIKLTILTNNKLFSVSYSLEPAKDHSECPSEADRAAGSQQPWWSHGRQQSDETAAD